jgi:hypothetical protein
MPAEVAREIRDASQRLGLAILARNLTTAIKKGRS